MINWRDFSFGFLLAASIGFFYNVITASLNSNSPKPIIQIRNQTIIREVPVYICPSKENDYYIGFVRPQTQEAISKEQILKYVHETPMNWEPLAPKITGPRETPVPLKSLVAVAAGVGSEEFVDKIISVFGFQNFTFIIFLYHPLNKTEYLKQPWFNNVIFVHYPGQMKWWYMKRFLVPLAVKQFEYIFVFDDDVELDANLFKPLEYIQLLRAFNIHLSQPAHVPDSTGALHQSTHRRNNFKHGHWNDMVECGPGTVFSSIIWQTCIWDFIQEDLASGYGIDLMWHNYCKKMYGFNTTAIIDKYPMKHGNRRTSYDNGEKYNPHAEWAEYRKRFGRIVSEAANSFTNPGGPDF